MPSGSRGPSQDNLLPHSVDAEKGVLSSMMQSPASVIPIVLRQITADFFFVPAHRTVFCELRKLFSSNGANFDLIMLTQHFVDVGQVNSIGGPAFLTEVYNFVPSAENVTYYIEILRDKYGFRSIIEVCNQSARLAHEISADPSTGPQDMFDQLQRKLDETKNVLSGSRALPELHDVSKFLGANRPAEPPEIVKGLLHQGSKLIVGGTSKGRKTYALLDLAISVTCGVSWWGFECGQGRVCYLNLELQEPFFYQRVEDICRAKQCTLSPNALMGWTLRGHGKAIESLANDLLPMLLRQEFLLIIVDPIYKALGNRDENKAGDVATMLNELERIAVRTGAAVAFGAHYSKGNQAAKESIDRIGGSGVFARDPDSILTMTAHQALEAFTVDATLRNFKPIEPFVLRWEWPLFVKDDALNPADLKQPKNRGRPTSAVQNAERLLDLIAEGGLRYGEFLKAAQNHFGIKEKAFEKYFSILKANGRIQKVDELWILTA